MKVGLDILARLIARTGRIDSTMARGGYLFPHPTQMIIPVLAWMAYWVGKILRFFVFSQERRICSADCSH